MSAKALALSLIYLSTAAGCGSGSSSDGDGGAGDSGTDDRVDANWIDASPPVEPGETCVRPVDLADVTASNYVVGNGSAASCTEAEFAAAIAAGGVITFDCGDQPHTITLTSEKVITGDTIIDGGDSITLSGGGTTRILNMDTGDFTATSPHLTVQRLTFTAGKASGTPTSLGTDVDGGGGAIYYRGGSVTAIDCTFVENVAAEVGPDVGGGAIYGVGVGETIIVGCRLHANRGSNGGAVGALHTGLTIVNSTVTGNTATGYGANYIDEHGNQAGHGGNGGAIVMDGNGRRLEICGCDISGNTGGAHGGALFRTGYETEPSVIDRTTIDGNQIPDHADSEEPSSGGGLYIQGTHVTLTSSTVSNNSSRGYAGVWVLGHGATPAIADLTNVTITGNSTWPQDPFTDRGIGAGLIIGDNTTGTVQNCTIVNNSAQFASGIIRVSPLTVNNTIIANNAENEWTPLNCTGSSYADPPGSGQNNVQWPEGIQDDMDCTTGITRADPEMGALADNGGPTMTVEPGNAALQMGTGCPATDQRGEPRATPCTIGAMEVAW